MEKKKSVGVTIFAVINIIICIPVGGFFAALAIEHFTIMAHPSFYYRYVVAPAIISIVCLVLLIGNIGILLFKKWGLRVYLTFIWIFAFLFYNVFFVMRGIRGRLPGKNGNTVLSHIMSALIYLIIFLIPTIYFTRSKAKEQFK